MTSEMETSGNSEFQTGICRPETATRQDVFDAAEKLQLVLSGHELGDDINPLIREEIKDEDWPDLLRVNEAPLLKRLSRPLKKRKPITELSFIVPQSRLAGQLGFAARRVHRIKTYSEEWRRSGYSYVNKPPEDIESQKLAPFDGLIDVFKIEGKRAKLIKLVPEEKIVGQHSISIHKVKTIKDIGFDQIMEGMEHLERMFQQRPGQLMEVAKQKYADIIHELYDLADNADDGINPKKITTLITQGVTAVNTMRPYTTVGDQLRKHRDTRRVYDAAGEALLPFKGQYPIGLLLQSCAENLQAHSNEMEKLSNKIFPGIRS